MHRHQRPLWGAPLRMATCLALAGAAMAAHAQPPDTLAQAFEQAWATQPLPQALSARRSALAASRQAADAWTAQPAALELRTKTDRPGTDRGAQELEVGVALPLWLPGPRPPRQGPATPGGQGPAGGAGARGLVGRAARPRRAGPGGRSGRTCAGAEPGRAPPRARRRPRTRRRAPGRWRAGAGPIGPGPR